MENSGIGIQLAVDFENSTAISNKLKSVLGLVDKNNEIFKLDTAKFDKSVTNIMTSLNKVGAKLEELNKINIGSNISLKDDSFKDIAQGVDKGNKSVQELEKNIKRVNAETNKLVRDLSSKLGLSWTNELQKSILSGVNGGSIKKFISNLNNEAISAYYKNGATQANKAFTEQYKPFMDYIKGMKFSDAIGKDMDKDQFQALKRQLRGYVTFTKDSKVDIDRSMGEIVSQSLGSIDSTKVIQDQILQLGELVNAYKMAKQNKATGLGEGIAVDEKAMGKHNIGVIKQFIKDYEKLMKQAQDTGRVVQTEKDKMSSPTKTSGVKEVSRELDKETTAITKFYKTTADYQNFLFKSVKKTRDELGNITTITTTTNQKGDNTVVEAHNKDFIKTEQQAKKTENTIVSLMTKLQQLREMKNISPSIITGMEGKVSGLQPNTLPADMQNVTKQVNDLNKANAEIVRLKDVLNNAGLALNDLQSKYTGLVPDKELNTFVQKLAPIEGMIKSLSNGVVLNSADMKQAVNDLNSSFKNLEGVAKNNRGKEQKQLYAELNGLVKQESKYKMDSVNADAETKEYLKEKIKLNQQLQSNINSQINTKGLENSEKEIELQRIRETNETKYNVKLKESVKTKKDLIVAQEKSMKTQIAELQTLYGNKFDSAKGNDLLSRLSSIDTKKLNLKQVKLELRDVQELLNQAGKQAKASSFNNAYTEGAGAMSNIINTMSRFGIFVSGAMVVRRFFNEFKEGIQHIKYMDSAYTDLNITMDISKKQFGELANNIGDLAKANGSTVDKVTEIAKVYANANATIEEINSKLEPSVAFANVSRMDAGEVTSTLQSVNNQFKLTSEGGYEAGEALEHIGDVMTAVSQNMEYDFGKGINQLNDAIKESGSVAEMAGQSLESYTAMAGAYIVQTGKTGLTNLGLSINQF